jgi:hypothetical protein
MVGIVWSVLYGRYCMVGLVCIVGLVCMVAPYQELIWQAEQQAERQAEQQAQQQVVVVVA